MDTPPLANPVKSLEFYYADGNVVFRVRTNFPPTEISTD